MVYTVLAEDPNFEKPNEFRPERFLESDGKSFKKVCRMCIYTLQSVVDRLIPFGMGKRMCAGEGLARMELFMGLVSLLQAN